MLIFERLVLAAVAGSSPKVVGEISGESELDSWIAAILLLWKSFSGVLKRML